MSAESLAFYTEQAARAGVALPSVLTSESTPLMPPDAIYRRQRPDLSIEQHIGDVFAEAVLSVERYVHAISTIPATGQRPYKEGVGIETRTLEGFVPRVLTRDPKMPTEQFSGAKLVPIARSQAHAASVNATTAKIRNGANWLTDTHYDEAAYLLATADVTVRNRKVGKSVCLALILADTENYAEPTPRVFTVRYLPMARQALEEEAARLG